MRFLVVSGRSGSGKSSALHLLEDEGFTCIDNLPVNLLPALIEQVSHATDSHQRNFAIGIDARNISGDLSRLPELLSTQLRPDIQFEVIYLDSTKDVLLKRFSETRRKHPLSDKNTGLNEAITEEQIILAPIAKLADVTINTNDLNLHELRSAVRNLVVKRETSGMAIMLTSFGFKFGVPVDTDFVFDVRCLPNPYWDQSLRLKSGLDPEVAKFLEEQEDVLKMRDDILCFIKQWIPCFEQSNRSYLTLSIGCTGGMHRSVYICEQLAHSLKQGYGNVQTRHRQLNHATSA